MRAGSEPSAARLARGKSGVDRGVSALSLGALMVLASCGPDQPPAPGMLGDPCGGRVGVDPCAEGLICISTYSEVSTGENDICHEPCERSADCPLGGRCVTRHTYGGVPVLVCVGTGVLGLGEGCGPEIECGPGLLCHSFGGADPPVCRYACDINSPHSDERRCPPGFLCGPYDSAYRGVCMPMCDLSDGSPCVASEACYRWSGGLPDSGEVGICGYTSRDCGLSDRCVAPELCYREVCMSPSEAPSFYMEPEPPID